VDQKGKPTYVGPGPRGILSHCRFISHPGDLPLPLDLPDLPQTHVHRGGHYQSPAGPLGGVHHAGSPGYPGGSNPANWVMASSFLASTGILICLGLLSVAASPEKMAEITPGL
jgi:hypothetical protein